MCWLLHARRHMSHSAEFTQAGGSACGLMGWGCLSALPSARPSADLLVRVSLSLLFSSAHRWAAWGHMITVRACTNCQSLCSCYPTCCWLGRLCCPLDKGYFVSCQRKPRSYCHLEWKNSLSPEERKECNKSSNKSINVPCILRISPAEASGKGALRL